MHATMSVMMKSAHEVAMFESEFCLVTISGQSLCLGMRHACAGPLQEKHELEEQRQQLLEEVASYRRKIKQLEDDLLFRLSNSQVRMPKLTLLPPTPLNRSSGCGLAAWAFSSPIRASTRCWMSVLR